MARLVLSQQSMELLNNYYPSNTKGDDLEEVAKEILKSMKYEYSKIEYEMPTFQYLHGDLIVMDRDYSIKSIDVKASHTFKNTDKLGIDLRYCKKGTRQPYTPSNATDNKGWGYHLLSDTVMAINPSTKKLYIINNFQRFRKRLIDIVEEYCNDWSILESMFGIELAFNKSDYNKDTLVANVDFKSMKILGADILEMNLTEESELRSLDYNNKFEYDILNLDKKNTLEPTKVKSII